MNASDDKLATPIYLKTRPDMAWPAEDKVFHLLTADGLFLCRNHRFFTSSVPARHWPSELAAHGGFIELRYPKIPRALLERVIGFFDVIGQRGAEAAVLLAYVEAMQRLRVIVPSQVSTVSSGWGGRRYPVGVQYDIPRLPDGWTLIGDIHSHVDDPAYASYTDQNDERHGAGLHLVAGRILSREPPEFHLEVTADGTRFPVADPGQMLEGYHQRRCQVPLNWISQVQVVPWTSARQTRTRGDQKVAGYDSRGGRLTGDHQ